MAALNFDACNKETRKWEGGDVNHPSDPGGLTSRGVTAKRGAAWRKKKHLAPKVVTKWTNAEVDAFYRSEFWNVMSCDDLPYGVDLSTYDAGVNSGPGRGLKWKEAAADSSAAGSVAGRAVPLEWIKGICKRRLSFVQGLRTWKVFGRGWARRIAGIEAKSFSMWLAFSQSGSAREVLLSEAEASDLRADRQSTAQKATPVGGAASAGIEPVATGDVNWLLIGGIGFVTLAIVVILAIKIMQNRERSNAFADEAISLKTAS